MHLVYILQHSESSSCIICFLSMRTCNNTSKACRPCAVQHLPTRLLQAAVIRFCSRQPQVDAAIHSHGVVCARHRRLDPLIELGDRCTCCRHNTLKANEACLRTLRPHFRVQALVGILCCPFQAATQQIRVAESHIDLLDMSRDIPCQWRAQLVTMGTWLLSRCQRPLEETPAVAVNGAARVVMVLIGGGSMEEGGEDSIAHCIQVIGIRIALP